MAKRLQTDQTASGMSKSQPDYFAKKFQYRIWRARQRRLWDEYGRVTDDYKLWRWGLKWKKNEGLIMVVWDTSELADGSDNHDSLWGAWGVVMLLGCFDTEYTCTISRV